MILVDTSAWIDHLQKANPALVDLLNGGRVLVHPFVIGELALGHMRQRSIILGMLHRLPQTMIATDSEVLRFIEQHKLYGRGIGFVDAHLLAATQLTPDASLWTHDKHLLNLATKLDLAADADSFSNQ